ncbi:MAG: restriction endonuclease subunit S [Acidobacteriota bacterium]
MSDRDSGIPWIGRIPDTWDVGDLMWRCSERRAKNIGNRETNVLSLSYGRIVRRDVGSNQGLLPESFETYQIVHPGDIVLRLTDLQNDKRSLRTGLVLEQGIITSAYVAIEAGPNLAPEFLHYLLHSYDTSKVFYGFGGGVRQSMKFADLKHLPLALPPFKVQGAIADFLDRKTAAIDALIERKERLLTLLAEKRAALIHQAVTKGLDPNVPMKGSGIPWIGEIPAHWEVSRVKFQMDNLNYRRIPLSADERGKRSGEYPYYGASGIIDHVDGYLFSETTILVAEDGANLVLRNLPLAIVANGSYWVNNHAHILRPKDREFAFWAAVLESLDYRSFVSGSAQPKLTAEAIGNVEIGVPPIEERRGIAEAVAGIESGLAVPERRLAVQIDRLREYRQALITAAVTGQLDIREAA